MGKTVPLDGTLMRESALGGNSLENLGSKANALHSCECFNNFKIAENNDSTFTGFIPRRE